MWWIWSYVTRSNARNQILRMHDEFFSKMEDDLDAKIAQSFFGPKTKDDVLEKGRQNHAKMLEYIENQVLEDEDIDF